MYKRSTRTQTQHVFTSRGSPSAIIANRLDPADCKVCLVPPRKAVTATLTPTSQAGFSGESGANKGQRNDSNNSITPEGNLPPSSLLHLDGWRQSVQTDVLLK